MAISLSVLSRTYKYKEGHEDVGATMHCGCLQVRGGKRGGGVEPAWIGGTSKKGLLANKKRHHNTYIGVTGKLLLGISDPTIGACCGLAHLSYMSHHVTSCHILQNV